MLMRGSSEDAAGMMEFCTDERALINRFEAFVRETDPDLIIGWNIIGFDLAFIEKRAEHYGLKLRLGRSSRPLRLMQKRSGFQSAGIDGRIVIDGPQTLRTAFYKFENFRLETVAKALLGRGKDIAEEGSGKVAEIERRFREGQGGACRLQPRGRGPRDGDLQGHRTHRSAGNQEPHHRASAR